MEVGRHFPHKDLPTLFEAVQKGAVAPVAFVKGPGLHTYAVSQGDRSSPARSAACCGTRRRRERNFFSAFGIRGPVFGQVDFTIQQALKAGCAVAEMHADDAVVDLAATPQPLPRGARAVPTVWAPLFAVPDSSRRPMASS